MTTITLPVTVAGITRDVEFHVIDHGDSAKAFSPHGTFTARIGQGTKTHRASVTAWRFPDRAAARARGYQPADIVELADGTTWAIARRCVVLNRQAVVTGWAEEAAATSQHIMER